MRSLILSVFINLTGIALVTALPAQQSRVEGKYTVAVNVDLVVFNVTVTDGKGRPVLGLHANDFQVSEEKHPQQITLFKAEDVPASIGLVIDASDSMHDKQDDVTRAALTFVRSSNPEDELFVVSFSEKVHLGLPPSISFTSDPDQIRSALLRTPPQGMTALYDALAVGIDHLQKGTRDRKALVVLSDGGDNSSRNRLEDVLTIARRSSATIYTIGIYSDTDPDRNPRVLHKMAETSGGRAYFPKSVNDMEQAWRDIASGIRSQYTIGFRPTNLRRDGTFRHVIITAASNGNNLRVTTRDGYIAPDSKSDSR